MSIPESGTADGQAGLDAIMAHPDGALIASDFDGTLAPIVPDPAAARAAPGAAAALARLTGLVGTVAIITGRAPADAVELGGFAGIPGLIVLGHYGAERWAGGVLTPAAVPAGVALARQALARVLAEAGAPAGTRLEDKGNALAVHTRQAADPEAALGLLRAPLADLAARSGLALEPGRLVLELRPPGMDKGAALRLLAKERNATAVLFCGDDLGDLAAFSALRELRAEGVPSCAVASSSLESPQVAAAADLVVNGPADIVRLLAAIADKIAGAAG